jgi:hypothetical protein
MADSPTRMMLEHLRRHDFDADVAERWIPSGGKRKCGTCKRTIPSNPAGGVRRDLFNFVDVVAMKAGDRGLVGVQATTAHNQPARLHKMREAELRPRVALWVEWVGPVWIVGFRKLLLGNRERWVPRVWVLGVAASGLIVVESERNGIAGEFDDVVAPPRSPF